jgi:Ca2+-binding RTX toxin-like protein
VAAATAATTLLGAAPAYAATPVTTSVSTSTVFVTGTASADSVTASGGNGTITLSSLLGPISAGPGCVQLGATVRCSGVRAIVFSGGEGDDAFRNDTSTPSDLFGQLGNDRLSGGSGNDVIRGASGTDFAFGLGGFDSCIAENESGCEA